MVEIVSGAGLGLERSSALLLGTQGTLGSAAQGRVGDNVIVNAATGNLVIQSQDELLTGVGLNAVINTSYNSLGVLTDAANNNLAAIGAQIVNVTGPINIAGSTAQRIGWDGSVVTYTYSTTFTNADGSTGAYVAKEAAGADDSLSFDGANWSWHQSATGIVEH